MLFTPSAENRADGPCISVGPALISTGWLVVSSKTCLETNVQSCCLLTRYIQLLYLIYKEKENRLIIRLMNDPLIDIPILVSMLQMASYSWRAETARSSASPTSATATTMSAPRRRARRGAWRHAGRRRGGGWDGAGACPTRLSWGKVGFCWEFGSLCHSMS